MLVGYLYVSNDTNEILWGLSIAGNGRPERWGNLPSHMQMGLNLYLDDTKTDMQTLTENASPDLENQETPCGFELFHGAWAQATIIYCREDYRSRKHGRQPDLRILTIERPSIRISF